MMMCATVIDQQKKRQPFTPEQDQFITNLVNQSNGKRPNWKLIAEHLGKTARQCRERYRMYLAPSLTNQVWTQEEDQLLLDLVKKNGKHWAKFKPYFPGRSDNNIKNRYNFHLVPIRGPKKRDLKRAQFEEQFIPQITQIEPKATLAQQESAFFEQFSSEIENACFMEEEDADLNIEYNVTK